MNKDIRWTDLKLSDRDGYPMELKIAEFNGRVFQVTVVEPSERYWMTYDLPGGAR